MGQKYTVGLTSLAGILLRVGSNQSLNNPFSAAIIGAMAKYVTPRKSRTSRRSSTPEAIPLGGTSEAATRLALKFDKHVSTTGFTQKSLAKLQAEIAGATIRGGGGAHLFDFSKAPAGLRWPDTLYVPGDQRAVGIPRPPADHLYSQAWNGPGGTSSANTETGAVAGYAGAKTTESGEVREAGVGIIFTPKNTLSYVRFEPEADCAVTYRTYANFWPDLIAGNFRARASLLTAAWERSPVDGSFALLRWQEFPVLDTNSLDASSNVFANVPSVLQKSFRNSALGMTFQLQNGRSYLLGLVARVQVEHNVTTNYGKVIPHDGNKFKLYSNMVCQVPYMLAAVQTVLIP
jgi:hypothetical protein